MNDQNLLKIKYLPIQTPIPHLKLIANFQIAELNQKQHTHYHSSPHLLSLNSNTTSHIIISPPPFRMESTPTIRCPNPSCNSKLKKTSSAYLKCQTCRTTFFSFCHEFQDKIFEYVPCKKCTNQLYYFFCAKCQAVLCFMNYRMGSISKCKCGFDGCYVVCNNCNSSECYPPGKSYEGIPWCCTKCNLPFNFMTCGSCYHPVYCKYFNAEDTVYCANPKCYAKNKVKNCKECQEKYLDTRKTVICTRCQKKANGVDPLKLFYDQMQKEDKSNPKTPPTSIPAQKPVNQQKSQPQLEIAKPPITQPTKKLGNTSNPTTPSPHIIEKSFGKQIESLCKICLDKPSEYINIKCFHMSCCGVCVDSMKNTCPICRAEGEFHKVFR